MRPRCLSHAFVSLYAGCHRTQRRNGNGKGPVARQNSGENAVHAPAHIAFYPYDRNACRLSQDEYPQTKCSEPQCCANANHECDHGLILLRVAVPRIVSKSYTYVARLSTLSNSRTVRSPYGLRGILNLGDYDPCGDPFINKNCPQYCSCAMSIRERQEPTCQSSSRPRPCPCRLKSTLSLMVLPMHCPEANPAWLSNV